MKARESGADLYLRQAVVVTGMGAWCGIGDDLDSYCESLRTGASQRTPVAESRFDTTSPVYRTRTAAQLPQSVLTEFAETDHTLHSALASQVGEAALRDAGLSRDALVAAGAGVMLGTTVGGSHAFVQYVKGALGLPDGDKAATAFPWTAGSIAGNVAKHFGLRGPTSTISTACAAGTNSICRGLDMIRKGRATAMLVGGVDVFSELTFSGFNSLQALSRETCSPFDQDRDGLMLGDGCAMLVLESAASATERGARIYGEICGYGIANEAYHPTGPDPEGRGALRVMQGALSQSGLTASDVQYINAHGTGTKANDEMELKAIRMLLGSRAPEVAISSTKSMIGHTLGAAGSLEAVATLLGLYHRFLPPSINLHTIMEGYEDFWFVRDRAQDYDFDVAISNSFGFGGNVATIALRGFARAGL